MSHQTHPFINIICKSLDEIKTLLIDNPPRALHDLNLILRAVDPDKRKTCVDYSPTLEKIKGLITKRTAIHSPSPEKYDRLRAEFDHKHYPDLVELYDRVWAIMWDCGYMFDATFRVEIKEDKPIG